MKRVITLIFIVLLTQINMIAQESTKKILLATGHNKNIHYKNLNINALLQEYDKTSKAHLIGNVYLRINNNNKNETIADFYIENNQLEDAYYTKIYQNHFLTFKIENNKKYLIIEQAQFGKAFALSNNGNAAIGVKNDSVEIEIIDFYHEEGYTAPPEDNNRKYFTNVHYTLKVKVKDTTKNFSFYSSQVKNNYIIDIGNYKIQILSDKYKNSTAFIEMIINKK